MDRSVRRHHSSPGSSASASPRQGPLSLRGAECLPTVLPWTPLPWNTSDSETSVLCPGPPWCCRRAPAAVESTLRWCGHQRGAWCPPSRCRPCCPARVHRIPRLRSRTSPDGRQRVTRLLLPVSQLRRIPRILGPLAARPIETAGRTWCGTAWNRCCSPSVWGRTRLGTLVFSCSGRRCVPLWPRAWALRESAGSAPGVLSTPCLAGRAFRWALR